MAKRGRTRAVPQVGRRLTRSEIAAIKAEQPGADGRYNLEALAVQYGVVIPTIKRHLRPPRRRVMPFRGSKLPPGVDPLIKKLLKNTSLSYHGIATRVFEETGVRVSRNTVRHRATKRTKRSRSRLETINHFKDDAAKRDAIFTSSTTIGSVAANRFEAHRRDFEVGGYRIKGAVRKEIETHLHRRLDYYNPDREPLESFIRREATRIGRDLLNKARRRAERSRKLARDARLGGYAGTSSPKKPTPFALLGLHGKPFVGVPVATQRRILEEFIGSLTPRYRDKEFRVPTYVRMRALDGASYGAIAEATGQSIRTPSSLIHKYRPRMKKFVRARLKEMA